MCLRRRDDLLCYIAVYALRLAFGKHQLALAIVVVKMRGIGGAGILEFDLTWHCCIWRMYYIPNPLDYDVHRKAVIYREEACCLEFFPHALLVIRHRFSTLSQPRCGHSE